VRAQRGIAIVELVCFRVVHALTAKTKVTRHCAPPRNYGLIAQFEEGTQLARKLHATCIVRLPTSASCRISVSLFSSFLWWPFNDRDSQNPNEPQPKFFFFIVPPPKQWKVKQHASDVLWLKRGFSHATAHAQHTCDGFGGHRAFWSFFELFGVPICGVVFWILWVHIFN
jgi:hypothetical protein